MNSNEIFVPVARLCAGLSAASLDARPSLAVADTSVLATARIANIREMAPSRAAAGVGMPSLRHGPAQAKPRPGFAHGKQNNPAQTYAHAIGAVASGDGQMGSLPAWDPV